MGWSSAPSVAEIFVNEKVDLPKVRPNHTPLLYVQTIAAGVHVKAPWNLTTVHSNSNHSKKTAIYGRFLWFMRDGDSLQHFVGICLVFTRLCRDANPNLDD